MKVGLVLPTFQGEQRQTRKMLHTVLQAWRHQEPPVDEIVVVDDMSEEQYMNDVRQLARWYKCVYVRLEKDVKKYRLDQCYNLGASILNTDVVIFMGEDWLPTNTFIRKTVEVHNKWKNVVLVYGMRDLNKAGEEEVKMRIENISPPLLNHEWLDRYTVISAHTPVQCDIDNPEVTRGTVGCYSVRSEHFLSHDNQYEGYSSTDADFVDAAVHKGLVPLSVRGVDLVHLVGPKAPGLMDTLWYNSTIIHRKRTKRGHPPIPDVKNLIPA